MLFTVRSLRMVFTVLLVGVYCHKPVVPLVTSAVSWIHVRGFTTPAHIAYPLTRLRFGNIAYSWKYTDNLSLSTQRSTRRKS